ncbi:flagellar protein FlaG [Desulfoferrobacter suflitae]|uniref:flagellar protein FlaG n=1 Tax=Desulfoferrobacter suflitae TaxID=2865782 RepID=UPI00216441D2|nr:flagellar protein FlaG [Desulfoferrobacter suflitae]MCK8602390.1 flagellar protein FlaG [Desulfoferrobacter suflitae]
MEAKIREVQALAQESWQKYEHNPRDSALIQPIKKAAAAQGTRARNDRHPGSPKSADTEESGTRTRELAEEIQQCLKEVQIQLNFEVHEQTGDLIVQVINHETGNVIRQIPPKELIELREKLTELRGVLFNDKV